MGTKLQGACTTMRTRENEPRVIAKLWPLRPFDATVVIFVAILAAIFGSNGTDSSGWLWLWVGTSVGLLIVLARVHRRVRGTPGLRNGGTHDQ
jgi:hypothetical protein